MGFIILSLAVGREVYLAAEEIAQMEDVPTGGVLVWTKRGGGKPLEVSGSSAMAIAAAVGSVVRGCSSSRPLAR